MSSYEQRAKRDNLRAAARRLKLAKKRYKVVKWTMRALCVLVVLGFLLVFGAAVGVISPGYWACIVPLMFGSGFIIYGHMNWYTTYENTYEEALEDYEDWKAGS